MGIITNSFLSREWKRQEDENPPAFEDPVSEEAHPGRQGSATLARRGAFNHS